MTSPIQDYCLIPLTQGQFAKVSSHRYEEIMLWKWCAYWCIGTKSFYAARTSYFNRQKLFVQMHRQILDLSHGDKRKGDHINHETLDNRDSNLRIATNSQNVMNSRKTSANTSGYKGVYLEKRARYGRKDYYLSYIRAGGITRKLGRFPVTPEGLIEAAKLYDEAAIELFGEFAHLNFPTRPPQL